MSINEMIIARIDALMDKSNRTEREEANLRKLCAQRARLLKMPGRR